MSEELEVSVLTLAAAIAEVSERLPALALSVGEEDQKAIRKITQVWDRAVHEIGSGGLTLPTCKRGMTLLIAVEEDSMARVLAGGTKQDLNMFYGIKMIHQTMGRISKQQGINEGGKDCCPYCGGCS